MDKAFVEVETGEHLHPNGSLLTIAIAKGS